ncbi:gliding motility-associated C-terminal domain-containing protein [Larkinella insperata]|uniref:Gliding motility-associated C-terminal domain-containing protein n=1 Tax=Larkinella insperata TaxID=332158 RepID=A0ABW3Q930_9BACT|nr:gliding motility-associated C-terminal domain-containing protein [Larkinella insperata]
MNMLLNRRAVGLSVRHCFKIALCSLLLGLLTTPDGYGKHIYGGEMNLQATARPNYSTLTLTLYLDQANASPSSYEQQIDLYIFQKSDHSLVTTARVHQTASQRVRYENQACADLRNLSVLAMNYSTELYLNPNTFSDPGGYYVVWDRCCRSADISNIQDPGGEGMVFYMEFPPVQRNGAAFPNSSPQFSFPNGDYICVGKPFQLNFGATDTDGDQLRYSLVTPLAGYTNSTGLFTVGDGSSHETYPEVSWLPGYSATTAIPGNPALKIDPQTGQLSVTARQAGLFIFAVLCEEYRNGVRIGAIRREFQMPVVDCGNNTPPPPVISYKNIETLDLSICEGATVTLATEADPRWSYQWQHNGANMAGATSATVTVSEPGDYVVVKSFASICGNDTTSKITRVQTLPPPAATITPDKEPKFCEGQSLALSIQPEKGTSYQWTENGTALPGATGSSITVNKAGLYGVRATSSLDCVNRDSLAVVVNPNPTATLTSSTTAICQDGEVRLNASAGSNFQYEWRMDNTALGTGTAATMQARLAGAYQVLVTDANGCQSLSAPLPLSIVPRPDMQFDTVAPVCASRTEPVLLAASPAGGVFSGAGVTGNQFIPSNAGAGLYTITYTYAGNSACPAAISRQIRVEPSVVINMPERITVLMGNSVPLKPTLNGQPVRFQWEPPETLSDATTQNPTATPPTSTTYKLTVTSSGDCRSEKSVLVDVLKRMFIADAFSPNNDGINDALEIRNTDQFPDCEVTIYNRWGEVVFFSKGYDKPWNGTYLNQKVQAGTYQYRIKTNQPILPEYRGSVLVTY